MQIILIGYRGSGKSAVGKRIAEKLKVPFYDTDELIERGAGRSIRDMVAEKGWQYFRKRENEIIRKLAILQEGVVATGGGAVLDQENCDILKERGLVIWLTADVMTMVERIEGDAASEGRRPSLLHDDNIRETEDALKRRLPLYRGLADFSIDTTGKSIDEIVETACRFFHQTARFVRKESTCQEVP